MIPLLSEYLGRLGYKDIERKALCCYAPGTIPVLLVAHIDTVHHRQPAVVYHDQDKGVLWAPEGLGADDRAGVYGVLELLCRGHRPHVLFTDEEESGGYGARAAAKGMQAPPVQCMIQMDRAGDLDCVFYSCANGKWEKWVEKHGFKTAIGSFTDISILMPEWGIAGANLSIGYYNQHTSSEILKLPECMATIDKVEAMLLSPPEKRYKYHKAKSKWTGNWTGWEGWANRGTTSTGPLYNGVWSGGSKNGITGPGIASNGAGGTKPALEWRGDLGLGLDGKDEEVETDFQCESCDQMFPIEELVEWGNKYELCADCASILYGHKKP